jgi:hypothetical protein
VQQAETPLESEELVEEVQGLLQALLKRRVEQTVLVVAEVALLLYRL